MIHAFYKGGLSLWRLTAWLVLVAASASAALERDGAVRTVADRILSFQASDGAIMMDALPLQRDTRISPYVGNFAAQGLVAAYTVTHEARFLDAARRWIGWYEAHFNADGTVDDFSGHPGSWKSTGDKDSTDSYAATYLDLVRQIQVVSPDPKWLAGRASGLKSAVAAIRLTLQTNGLTMAKPGWPAMYTMDNTETALGLRAGSRIARWLGQTEIAKQADALATRMVQAVSSELWDNTRKYYRVGVQANGSREDYRGRWYPDVMANLMAIAWLPAASHNQELWNRLKTSLAGELPATVVSGGDLGRLVWWGHAAIGIGDRPFADEIRSRLVRSAPALRCIGHPDALGHVCRILAAPSRGASSTSSQ